MRLEGVCIYYAFGGMGGIKGGVIRDAALRVESLEVGA